MIPPKQLFLVMSSLLFATTNSFQTPKNPPSHPKRASIPTSQFIPSKLHYTYTDIPEAVKDPAFDVKVRNILKETSTTDKKTGLSNLKSVNSKDELRNAVLEDEDRLTVVRFHAPYCQSCKRMEPLMHNFARRNPDIQFVDVAYTKDMSNRQLVSSLGVPSFPYCHVYHPASQGLLEEQSVNRKHWKDFASIIESYQDGGCDLPPNPDAEDGTYTTPYKSLTEEEDVEEASSSTR